MSRNRNNSMHPMPNIRDDFYNKGPTPAIFNQEYANKCKFQNNNYKKTISDNTINYDTNINSIQQPFFKQNEFQTDNILDNNINKNIKSDVIKEINLVVDSMDRDMDLYPNSFNFKVKFNPTDVEKQPYINKKLENIKSIKIDASILPNYYKLEKTEVTGATDLDDDIITILTTTLTPNTDVEYTDKETIIIIWYEQVDDIITIDFFDVNDILLHEKVYSIAVDTSGPLTIVPNSFNYYTYKISIPTKIQNDRFIYLEIDELKNIDDYSTDVSRGQSFGILYHDRNQCDDNFCYMNSLFSEIKFPDSNLKNISSLTFKLYSSVGETLDTSTNKFSFTNITNKTKENEYINGSIKYVSALKYIRHPLYIKNQCHFIFKVKYVEPNINKILFN